MQVGGRRLALEAGGQRADGLLLREVAGGRVIVEHVDGAVELAHDVDDLATGVIDEVARTGLGLHFGRRRRRRRQLAGRRVERELVDPVVAERGHEHVAVGRVGHDRVRVGIVRQHLLRRLHRAGRPDRVHGDLVTGVRRTEQEAARPVGGDVGQAVGEGTAGDVLEPAARLIDGEARGDLRLAARADVEEAAVGTDRHRRRDARLLDAGDRDLLHDREVAALPIELEHVDLVALGVADVHERGGRRGGRHQRTQDQENRGEPCHDILRSGFTPAATPRCGSRRTRARSCARTRRRPR